MWWIPELLKNGEDKESVLEMTVSKWPQSDFQNSGDGIQMTHGKELNSTTRSEEGRTGCMWNEIETAHLFCYRLLMAHGYQPRGGCSY